MTEHEKLREAIAWAREHRNELQSDSLTFRQGNMLDTVLMAAESTLPKTKMVEVWHVEHCELGTPYVMVVGDAVIAQARALTLSKQADTSCIRVTGPHQQEIPA